MGNSFFGFNKLKVKLNSFGLSKIGVVVNNIILNSSVDLSIFF